MRRWFRRSFYIAIPHHWVRNQFGFPSFRCYSQHLPSTSFGCSQFTYLHRHLVSKLFTDGFPCPFVKDIEKINFIRFAPTSPMKVLWIMSGLYDVNWIRVASFPPWRSSDILIQPIVHVVRRLQPMRLIYYQSKRRRPIMDSNKFPQSGSKFIPPFLYISTRRRISYGIRFFLRNPIQYSGEFFEVVYSILNAEKLIGRVKVNLVSV